MFDVIVWLCLVTSGTLVAGATKSETVNQALVSSWAEKLGGELFNFGEFVSRVKQAEESYREAKVVEHNGAALAQEIAKELKLMMQMKVSAVQRIMDAAENAAIFHQDEIVPGSFEYYNSKMMVPTDDPEVNRTGYKESTLTSSYHFFNESINMQHSSVHVPVNVYDRAPATIKAIKWSENLDRIFKNNLELDPSLSWQYFGSSSGFLRQYPAAAWNSTPVDQYDCRMRPWFIEAVSSPKDMVILIDNSGSMSGIRKEIARHVVENILDTLGNNDFVNIFTFSNQTKRVVPCFENKLVQANLANIRELKLGATDFDTNNIANFSQALTHAFELLREYRELQSGANCNQAIMLITDGVPYNYKEIFKEFNWEELPFMPVRVFTYLIGKEVTDVREVKWMACANRGYYVHLSSLNEVQEKVLEYLPVMARPMVLQRTEHPIVWTPVYADVTEPKMMNWLWDQKEREEQKESFNAYRRNKDAFVSIAEQKKRFMQKIKRMHNQRGDTSLYNFMTTVSIPVFDNRENAVSKLADDEQEGNGNISEKILVNERWQTKIRETRIANILGVAGTDIPIADIEKLFMPHLLGVNGYAFIVTNNGYILTHPDLRPVYQNILKPSYNSIDLTEIELVDDANEPREFADELLQLRDAIINKSVGSKVFKMKYHFDDMKRVSRIRREYFHCGIKDTPFTLVLAIAQPHGLQRVQFSPLEEIHRLRAKGAIVTEFFKDDKWVIHPDWTYCKYLRYDTDKRPRFPSAKQEFLHFLVRMNTGKWKWLKRTAYLPDLLNVTGKAEKIDKDAYICDRDLVQSLVWDARVTAWFSNNITVSPDNDKRNEYLQRYGLSIVFISTHNGLTRWQDFHVNKRNNSDKPHFSEVHSRAIDEIWYKRAVQQHYVNPSAFVYSVEFNADDDEFAPPVRADHERLVTASHAIFKSDVKMKRKAPAAVVGFQFHHSALQQLFKNITSTCGEIKPCTKTCASDDLDCYILDNNGFIIVSERPSDTGRFFGQVNGHVMERLVDEQVYDRVTIYDYQAVCFTSPEITSDASLRAMMPTFTLARDLLRFLTWFAWWVMTQSIALAEQGAAFYYVTDEINTVNDATVDGDMGGNYAGDATPKSSEFDRRILIKRTKPKPCDQVVNLYDMNALKGGLPAIPCSDGAKSSRPFAVQQISNSNMILLVVNALCMPQASHNIVVDLVPKAINYNNSESLACYKIKYDLTRRRLATCIKSHVNESQIVLCGRGSEMTVNVYTLVSLLAVLLCTLQ